MQSWPMHFAGRFLEVTMNLTMNLGKVFSELVQAKKSVKDRVDDLSSNIALVDSQINAAIMAPSAREDVEAMLMNWIAEGAAEFHRGFAERLKPFVRTSRGIENPLEVNRMLALVGPTASDEQLARAIDCALCAAHGPALAAAMGPALDLQEWGKSPVTLRDKKSQLEKLHQRVNALRAEREELYDQAEQIGINLR